ncbi:MAG: TonB-dependent receptor [Pseudomonadota bacterium]
MTTSKGNYLARVGVSSLALGVATALVGTAMAQGQLEEVVSTAQRREQNVQDVPVSVSTMSEERFDAAIESGEDIRALAVRVPALYAESSNGRNAPRFYIRGLGNTDFDLAASQPVSVVVDEVVQENVILKAFPLFDIERVEVLRGPQGTLFGRNTPAGIVKFDTAKPTQEFDGDFRVSYGSFDNLNSQLGLGGALLGSEAWSGRLSLLYQNRDDWIDNGFTGGNDVMGGLKEFAYRGQVEYAPNDGFRMLANVHGRNFNGTGSIFRANIIGPGNNELNDNFDRDQVFFDEGNDNPQTLDSLGGSVRIEIGLGDVTLTSITAHETAEYSSLGDIDGGFGAVFLPGPSGPGIIPFPSQTQDSLDNIDQFTQELRLSSGSDGSWNWQAGVFYFDSEFAVTTTPFFIPPTTVAHENTAWAAFGQASFDLNDSWTLTGGVRYTDDEKDLTGGGATPVNVQDDQISWDLAAMWSVSDSVNLFARVAEGFRAPTIQGRDVAFGGAPSTATSETILSAEFGIKSELVDRRVRLNGSVWWYEISDQQLSAIGGANNFVQLVNADKGVGIGFDVDGEFVITDNFFVTAGFAYTDTELQDSTLAAGTCGTGLCTVLDPLDGNGNALVDGNAFPQAPDLQFSFTARWSKPTANGEIFVFTDWAYQGETQFLLYETAEFFSEDTFEGGLRIGYRAENYELALWGRNITDEENLKGGIDFNNLTGFVNQPRLWGVSYTRSLGN